MLGLKIFVLRATSATLVVTMLTINHRHEKVTLPRVQDHDKDSPPPTFSSSPTAVAKASPASSEICAKFLFQLALLPWNQLIVASSRTSGDNQESPSLEGLVAGSHTRRGGWAGGNKRRGQTAGKSPSTNLLLICNQHSLQSKPTNTFVYVFVKKGHNVRGNISVW